MLSVSSALIEPLQARADREESLDSPEGSGVAPGSLRCCGALTSREDFGSHLTVRRFPTNKSRPSKPQFALQKPRHRGCVIAHSVLKEPSDNRAAWLSQAGYTLLRAAHTR